MLLSLFVLSVVSLYLMAGIFRQKNSPFYLEKVYFILALLAVPTFSTLVYMSQSRDFHPHLLSSIILFMAALVPTTTLAHLGREHKKKRNISSRIPLLAFLLSLYLGLNYLGIFFLVTIIFTIIIFNTHKVDAHYFRRAFNGYLILAISAISTHYIQVFLKSHIIIEMTEILLAAGAFYFYVRLLNSYMVAEFVKLKLDREI